MASTRARRGRSATGAVVIQRASRSTVTVWHTSYTSWRWCEMNRKVTPDSWSARMRVKSRSISRLSSWAVGSSRTMNRAPKLNALAISTI